MYFSLQDLFDFIASTLKQFIEKEENGSKFSSLRTRELGFTFSFPVKQMSLCSGILLKWTKGFAIEDMVSWLISDKYIRRCFTLGNCENQLYYCLKLQFFRVTVLIIN